MRVGALLDGHLAARDLGEGLLELRVVRVRQRSRGDDLRADTARAALGDRREGLGELADRADAAAVDEELERGDDERRGAHALRDRADRLLLHVGREGRVLDERAELCVGLEGLGQIGEVRSDLVDLLGLCRELVESLRVAAGGDG
jgi:hypothetical protein